MDPRLQIQQLINEITDPEQTWITELGNKISKALEPEVQCAKEGLYSPLEQTQIDVTGYDPKMAKLLRETWQSHVKSRDGVGTGYITYKTLGYLDCEIEVSSTSDCLKTGQFKTVAIIIHGIDLPIQIIFDGDKYHACTKEYEIGYDLNRLDELFNNLTGKNADTDMHHRWKASQLAKIQPLSQIATNPKSIARLFVSDQMARYKTNRLLTTTDIHIWQNTCMHRAGYRPVIMPYYGEGAVVIANRMKFFYTSTGNRAPTLSLDCEPSETCHALHERHFPVPIYRIDAEKIERQYVIACGVLSKDQAGIEWIYYYEGGDMELYSLNRGTRGLMGNPIQGLTPFDTWE